MAGRSRVVVVGAGVGGLACAARLAATGWDVAVLEQAPVVGGKLGIREVDGFRFDTGPSLVTLPWTVRDVLGDTGAVDALDLRRLDPIARYRFADGTWLDAHADDDRFAAELDAVIGVGAAVQWAALMARAAHVWGASADPVLRSPLRGVRDLLPLAADPRDLAAVAPHRTVRSLGREYLSDPRLRVLLDRYATYSGSDPRRAPAALVTVPYAERRWGGWYVTGGLRRIADVLADRVRAHGGHIATSTPVSSITVRGGRATGVVTADGREWPADAVVANADAAVVADVLLPRAVGRPLRRRLRVAPRSLAGWVLLLGVRTDRLSGRAAAMPGHTVLFGGDYDAEFDALFGRHPAYATDPTIYVAVPDDPSVAPPGHQSWFVLVNAPRTDQVASPPAGYADRVLELMAARGIDVRPGVVLAEERPPSVLAREAAAPGGAIYGSSSNGPLAAFLRPPNAGPVEDLHLVGGSSHPGGGLPLVLLSAEIVARAVVSAR